MDWTRDLPTWSLPELSRRVPVDPHRWHVQETGTGKRILLLHGAGASTHSWRKLIPLLSETYQIIAVDLPGQGFTQPGSRRRFGLDATVEDLWRLLTEEDLVPEVIIGHSAGAAVALRLSMLSEETKGASIPVVAINAALSHFKGVAGWLFPLMAKMLALNPLTALSFSMTAGSGRTVSRLIEGTGSHLDPEDLDYYRRLFSDRAHVSAVLDMMAQWDIDPLLAALPSLTMPTLLITGDNDRAVPPETSVDAARTMVNAMHVSLDGLGHLAHEEDPGRVADIVRPFLDQNF